VARSSEEPGHGKERRTPVHLGAHIRWTALGRRVGYSEKGPVLRFIRIIHEALGIPAPKPSAVRQAIDDFNGRPR
jgi:hypothetical protein